MIAQEPESASAATELALRVRLFIDGQHFATLRGLEVTSAGGTVIIHGVVPTFHERQLAIAFCRRVAGVRAVVDHITVSPESASTRRPEFLRKPAAAPCGESAR